MRTLFLSLITLIAVAAVAPARASDCKNFYKLLAEELGSVKSDFLAKHNNHYTYEALVTPIKNQCDHGGCWSYGTVSNIESQILKNTGKSVDLSEQYLIMVSLLERTWLALEKPGNQVFMGGSLNLGERIIDEHGLVPAGVWSPRIPFEKAEFSGRFMTFINQRIAQFHLAAAKNPELRTNLLEDAKTDLRILFESYIGEAPQKFTFDGVEYSSPKDFAQRFLPPKTTTTNRIYLEKEADLPKSLAEAEPKSGPSNGAFNQVKIFKVHYKNEEDFEKVVIAAIKEGKTVSIATEMAREFIDHKTGIMSVKAFHTPPGFEPVPKNYRGAFGLTGGGHLMEIVGVDVDEAGRVIKYKIKNSWGVEAGDKGFYHMYPDYLRHYVQYIDIP